MPSRTPTSESVETRVSDDDSVLPKADSDSNSGRRTSLRPGGSAEAQFAEALPSLAEAILRKGVVVEGELPTPLPPLVMQISPEQKVLAVSEEVKEWFEIDESSAAGRKIEELFGKALYPKVSPFLEKALGGESTAVETESLVGSVGSRWLRHHFLPLRGAHGAVLGCCLSVEDLTQDDDYGEAGLRRALSAGSVGSWSWDLERNIIVCDAHMWRMFGLAETEEPRFLDSVHPEDYGRVAQAMNPSELAGVPHEVAYRVVAGTRSTGHVASRGAVVATRSGRPTRMAGVCFDITHRMRTEEELRRLNATLEYQRATALSLMRDAEEEMFRAAHAREDVRRHQQFLDSIVENIPSMVFVKDAEELRFLHANKATERLLGCSRDQLIGKTESELLPVEQAKAVEQIERKVIQTKQEINIPEQVVVTPRLGKRVLHTRKLPILDGDGNPRYLLAISDDITDRKVAEEALAKERSLLRTVIDNLPDYIFAKDTHSRYILNNRAHSEFVGANFAVEVLGKSDHDLFPPEEAEGNSRDDQNVMTSGHGIVDKEEPVRDRHGRRRWLSTTKVPLKRADGQVIGLVGLSRDITEQKNAAEHLQRIVGELARSNSELEQFAYIASHDLQEPLRKIQAFSSRVRDRWGEVLGEQGGDYLGRVENAAGRMQVLIEDLLSYSRVTSKAKPFVPVELSEVVEGVLSDLEARIERLNASVEVGSLPQVAADPIQMRQLMQNLIGNALKFNRPDETPVVRIQAEVVEGGAEGSGSQICRLVIEDNGIGFDPKHAAKIFQVFQRLHSRSEYQGSGIGLAVCKKIVDRHGGTIEAQGKPGQGATFVVTLPVCQAGESEHDEEKH